MKEDSKDNFSSIWLRIYNDVNGIIDAEPGYSEIMKTVKKISI